MEVVFFVRGNSAATQRVKNGSCCIWRNLCLSANVDYTTCHILQRVHSLSRAHSYERLTNASRALTTQQHPPASSFAFGIFFLDPARAATCDYDGVIEGLGCGGLRGSGVGGGNRT